MLPHSRQPEALASPPHLRSCLDHPHSAGVMSNKPAPTTARKAVGPVHAEDSQPNEQIHERARGNNPPLVRITAPANREAFRGRGGPPRRGNPRVLSRGQWNHVPLTSQSSGSSGGPNLQGPPVFGLSRTPRAYQSSKNVPHVNLGGIYPGSNEVCSVSAFQSSPGLTQPAPSRS